MQDKIIWLQQFLKPKMSRLYIPIGVLAFGVIGWLWGSLSPIGLIGLLFCAVMALIAAKPMLKDLSEWRSFFDGADEKTVREIVEDSVRSVMLRKNLYAGDEYIFGEYGVRAHRYTDILKTYLYVHKKNGIVNKKHIKVVTAKGLYTLCELDVRATTDEEISEIFAKIKSKNPSVHLGYK